MAIPAKQTTFTQFKVDVAQRPDPDGGEPIRDLILSTPLDGVLVFPMTAEAADRVGAKLREKGLVTPTDGESATILGADGGPARGD